MSKNILIIGLPEIISIGIKTIVETYFKNSSTYIINDDCDSLEDEILRHNIDTLIVDPLKSKVWQLDSISDHKRPYLIAFQKEHIEHYLLAGFDAIINISNSKNQIIEILRSNSTKPVKVQDKNNDLSEREKTVLVLVSKGMISKEIADKLNISINTVNTHRKNITKKTGIKSMAGLTVYAMLHGLI